MKVTTRVLLGGAVAAIAIPLSFYLAGSAGAAHFRAISPKNVSVRYTRVLAYSSAPVGRCGTITLTGTIKYRFSTDGRSSIWAGQRLVNPGFVVTVRRFSHGQCGAKAKLTALSLEQFIDGAGCGFNPSMAVTQPWTQTTADWPGCGFETRQQAGYKNGQDTHSRSIYAMTNDGTMVTFPAFSEAGSPTSPPCYAIQVGGDIYKGGDSDTVGGLSKKICLTKT